MATRHQSSLKKKGLAGGLGGWVAEDEAARHEANSSNSLSSDGAFDSTSSLEALGRLPRPDSFSGSCATEGGGGGKRILIYSHSLPPWVDGVSTRFRAHIRMLKEEGHEVHLMTIEPQLCESVQKHAASPAALLDSTHLYWYPAKRFPDLTWKNLATVYGACVRSRAQVMHVTMCPSLPLFFICSYLLNIPVVVSVHTDSVTLLGKCDCWWPVVRLVKMMEPLGTWFADATFTVSPSYAGILMQRGIQCLDVTWGGYANPVVFNPERAIDETTGKPTPWREKLTFGHPDEFVLAYAGRVSPEKDIGFLVNLVKGFRDRGHGVWLALIGDGPAAEEFKPLHGDPAHGVWFVPGFLPQKELAQVYASVDCVTSASTFEPFGFTALEAMQCGTPFLGPRAQGFRDVVAHGKGGYLFDARDLTSASHYLELLLHEKDELFPREGVLAATANFTARHCLKRTLQAYDIVRDRRDAAQAPVAFSSSFHRFIYYCARVLTACFMFFFVTLNWFILNAPLGAIAAHRGMSRVCRRAGALWDRRMRYTNLTRNRALVGSSVVGQ